MLTSLSLEDFITLVSEHQTNTPLRASSPIRGIHGSEGLIKAAHKCLGQDEAFLTNLN